MIQHDIQNVLFASQCYVSTMKYLVCRSPTKLDFYVPVFWSNYILYTIHELVHINKCAGSDFLDGQWQLHKIVLGHQNSDRYVSRIAVFWGSIVLLFRASQYCVLTMLDRNYCLFTSCLDHIFLGFLNWQYMLHPWLCFFEIMYSSITPRTVCTVVIVTNIVRCQWQMLRFCIYRY
jgi:hypothetical protein